MKKLLIIIFLVLMLVTQAPAYSYKELLALSDATVINTLEFGSTDNITIQLFQAWSGEAEDTSKLKLNPAKHYMIILVEVKEDKQ